MIGDILQPTHLIFIFVVALLVLGPKRLPEVGRSLGKGLRDFRGAMAGIEDQARDVFDPGDPVATATEPSRPVELATPAPPVEAPTVSSASPPEVTPAVPVSVPADPRAAGSGSGFTEPDPDDYAD